MGFVIRVAVQAVALAVAAWLFEGIRVTGADRGQQVLTLLVVAVIFGLVNAVIAPVIKLLSLPFIILTLGLLLLVINAFMLLLTSRIAQALELGFHVDGFWTAVWGSVVISVVSWVVNGLVND